VRDRPHVAVIVPGQALRTDLPTALGDGGLTWLWVDAAVGQCLDFVLIYRTEVNVVADLGWKVK